MQSFSSRLDALAGSGSDGRYPIVPPGDTATIFAGLGSLATPVATAVIIDPPRKGRDESLLAAGYTLTDVQPCDLFPQTRHLECVITLVKTPTPAAS